MTRGGLRLVLDTNVWLDWLAFGDPSVAAIKSAVAAGAHFLVTKDRQLLDLARRTARFGILPPEAFEAGAYAAED